MGIVVCESCGNRAGRKCSFRYGLTEFCFNVCDQCTVDNFVSSTEKNSSFLKECECCENLTYRMVSVHIGRFTDHGVMLCDECTANDMMVEPTS